MTDKPKPADFDRVAAYGQLQTFTEAIQVMRQGQVDEELTVQLAEIIRLVKKAYNEGIKKPGTLTVKITIEPLTADQVAFSVEHQIKGPKMPPESAILYVDEEEKLATQNPFAFRLDLTGGDMTRREHSVGELPRADPHTGEVL